MLALITDSIKGVVMSTGVSSPRRIRGLGKSDSAYLEMATIARNLNGQHPTLPAYGWTYPAAVTSLAQSASVGSGQVISARPRRASSGHGPDSWSARHVAQPQLIF